MATKQILDKLSVYIPQTKSAYPFKAAREANRFPLGKDIYPEPRYSQTIR